MNRESVIPTVVPFSLRGLVPPHGSPALQPNEKRGFSRQQASGGKGTARTSGSSSPPDPRGYVLQELHVRWLRAACAADSLETQPFDVEEVTTHVLSRRVAHRAHNTRRPQGNFQGGLFVLVLSRKNGQRVRIGQLIEVTVLESHNGRVKLGFSGPPEIPIHREEVVMRLDALQREPKRGVAERFEPMTGPVEAEARREE